VEVAVVLVLLVRLEQFRAGGNGGDGVASSITGSSCYRVAVVAVELLVTYRRNRWSWVADGEGRINCLNTIGWNCEHGWRWRLAILAFRRNGGNGGSGVVIIKVPDTVTATFTGATFGNNANDNPPFNNSLPITSVTGFNIYVVSQATAATVVFN
jgi:hypothetical protein